MDEEAEASQQDRRKTSFEHENTICQPGLTSFGLRLLRVAPSSGGRFLGKRGQNRHNYFLNHFPDPHYRHTFWT